MKSVLIVIAVSAFVSECGPKNKIAAPATHNAKMKHRDALATAERAQQSRAPSPIPFDKPMVIGQSKDGKTSEVNAAWVRRYRDLEKTHGSIPEDSQLRQLDSDRYQISPAISAHFGMMINN